MYSEREQDVLDLRAIESVSEGFAATADYRNYRLLKRSACYEADAAHKLYRMPKKIALLMKDRIFSEKYPFLVISFLQNFKPACKA